MAQFVTDIATYNPDGGTAPGAEKVKNPYTAIKIDTAGTIDLYSVPAVGGTPVSMGASEYAAGVWHHVLFSGVVAADAVIQVGRVCDTNKTIGFPQGTGA